MYDTLYRSEGTNTASINTCTFCIVFPFLFLQENLNKFVFFFPVIRYVYFLLSSFVLGMYEVSPEFRQKKNIEFQITDRNYIQLLNIKSVDISYHIITFPVPQLTGKRNTVANDKFSSVFYLLTQV